MASSKKSNPQWREFERLVARIEADASAHGIKVTSPDRIRCKVTGRLREVDASVRTKVGTSDVLVTIECRKRLSKQDVTWIEQLATKRSNIGASRTIAVSASGFSDEAKAVADHHGIDLRLLSEVSAEEINKLLKIDFLLFTHRRCTLVRIAFRKFKWLDWTISELSKFDFILPPETDPNSLIFKNIETGDRWSINDLWLQLQQATNPFAGIEKGQAPEIRTACFPYPGNVMVETPEGPKVIGDVLLSVALSLEIEKVDFGSAKTIEYADINGAEIFQRIEFSSCKPDMEDWRISLQMPKDSNDLRTLRTRFDQPESPLI
jgi:hypothetical protein